MREYVKFWNIYSLRHFRNMDLVCHPKCVVVSRLASCLFELKLKTIAPIKGRVQCYASSHSDFHLWSHDASKVCHREGYITLNTNIERIHVLVLSLQIVVFSNCSKSCTTRLWSLYITFSLRCECSTFSCARTPCTPLSWTPALMFWCWLQLKGG